MINDASAWGQGWEGRGLGVRGGTHQNLELSFENFSTLPWAGLIDHPVPGGVMELVTVPAIGGLVNLIFEAQSLGQCIQDIDGEPFVALGLSKDVLSHHHKRLFLRTTK